MHSKQPYAIYLRRGLLLVNVGNWGSRGKLRHYLPVLPGCCQIQLSRKAGLAHACMHLERRFARRFQHTSSGANFGREEY